VIISETIKKFCCYSHWVSYWGIEWINCNENIFWKSEFTLCEDQYSISNSRCGSQMTDEKLVTDTCFNLLNEHCDKLDCKNFKKSKSYRYMTFWRTFFLKISNYFGYVFLIINNFEKISESYSYIIPTKEGVWLQDKFLWKSWV
jgi:hypothetical protein